MKKENNREVKQKIHENESLRYILNSVIQGVTGIGDSNNILIASEEKKGIFIRYITVDISDVMTENFFDKEMLKGVSEVEIEFQNFVVFTVNDEGLLMNSSLLEYILIHDSKDFLEEKIWQLIDLSADEIEEINNEKMNKESLIK